MKKIYIIATFLLLALGIVEIVYLTHVDALASESINAEKIRSEIAGLDEKNQILQSKVLARSSLLVISSRAAELGFGKPDKFISLKKQNSIALKRE